MADLVGKERGIGMQCDKNEYSGVLAGLEEVTGKQAVDWDTATAENWEVRRTSFGKSVARGRSVFLSTGSSGPRYSTAGQATISVSLDRVPQLLPHRRSKTRSGLITGHCLHETLRLQVVWDNREMISTSLPKPHEQRKIEKLLARLSEMMRKPKGREPKQSFA